MAGMLTRYLSFVNTAGSPEFTVTNFTRDLPSAVLNILSEQEKADGKIKGEAIAARAALNVGKAITAIARYERADKVDPPPTPKKVRSIPTFRSFLSRQSTSNGMTKCLEREARQDSLIPQISTPWLKILTRS